MFSDADILKLINKATDAAFVKFKAGHHQDAEVILAQTLKVHPTNLHALQLMGLVKHATGQFDTAIDIFNKTLEIEPENSENYNNLGLCYSNTGQYDKAIDMLRKAIELNPSCAYFHNNLGLQYRHKDNIDAAIQSFQNALAISESDISWGMLGGCYGEKLELYEAEKCFKKALEINPKFAGAHVDLANVYHLQGHWDKAWPEYEWRTEVFEQLKVWKTLYDPAKQWKGESLAGKKIIVYGEQGCGDTIQFYRFMRYLKTLPEYGPNEQSHVTLHCDAALGPLFQGYMQRTVMGVDAIITAPPTSMSWVPDHDYHCSLLSLPYWLKGFPIPTERYLVTLREIDLGTYSDFFKIGIVWAGNPQHPNDARRSCPLAHFRGIHNIPGVKLFSLVKDTRPRMYRFNPNPVDLAEGTGDMKIVDMAPLMNTFEDTAAIINSLDLVISVDTAVLHLAGAMGKRTWALLPRNCDWRWLQTGEETVWYPSVRIFRQSHEKDWRTVFSLLEREIQNEQ